MLQNKSFEIFLMKMKKSSYEQKINIYVNF